jgi:hypothetical protein
VAHRVWVNGIAMSINADSLFVESTNIKSGQFKCTVLFVSHNSNLVFECHFPGQPVAHIYDVENMVH